MTIYQTVIGCDVSKARLDIFDNGTGRFGAVANNSKSIADWIGKLDRSDMLVVFEATGGYDRQLICGLEVHNISYARVNPARARDFARASGLLAKTDRLDARVLADMGVKMQLQADAVSSPQRIEIAELSTRRDQLVEFRKQDKTRANLKPQGQAGRSLERHIAWLDKEIDKLDKAIAGKIRACRQMKHQMKLLRTIPGIGPVAATVLVAMLPDLHQSTMTAANIAAKGVSEVGADVYAKHSIWRLSHPVVHMHNSANSIYNAENSTQVQKLLSSHWPEKHWSLPTLLSGSKNLSDNKS